MKIDKPWKLMATPDPGGFSFQTTHDPDKKLAWFTEVGDNGIPIPSVTLYKNWILREPKRADETYGGIWGNFILLDSTVGQEGEVVFTWAENKTQEEQNTPFRTWTEMGNHYWHPILHSVKFYPDTHFPVSTNGPDGGIIVAARLYDRISYTPAVSEGTLFQHDLFFSGTKFVIGQSAVPTPTAVSWSYHDSQGSFPECLHPKLVFPPIRSAFASFTTGGGTVAANGASNGQVFPSTSPFEEWQPYVLSDKQDQIDSGWLRHRITVFPPQAPDIITR